ncbi:hypothetical protein A0H81_03355 [Grifola frondosa]|uniref:Uncharacterized protein n=1 Tax=Grifola frondosa TaxID=5627 RepID=A0A1C7MGT3_GRIFR|nr:hypothetical protein A0H81_03355 [Grifola frondosa]
MVKIQAQTQGALRTQLAPSAITTLSAHYRRSSSLQPTRQSAISVLAILTSPCMQTSFCIVASLSQPTRLH